MAPVLLLVSAAVLTAITIPPSPPNLVDFHVYMLGGGRFRPAGLVVFVRLLGPITESAVAIPLPAVRGDGVLAVDLVAVPGGWTVVAARDFFVGRLWHRVDQPKADRQRRSPQRDAVDRRRDLVGTGADYVQSRAGWGVFLTLAVLYAVYSRRWWVSGLLVGLAAGGVKLTPGCHGGALFRRRPSMGGRGIFSRRLLLHHRALLPGRGQPGAPISSLM